MTRTSLPAFYERGDCKERDHVLSGAHEGRKEGLPLGDRGCTRLSMEVKACVGWGGLSCRKYNCTLPAVTACVDLHVLFDHANSSDSVSGNTHEITACQVICGCHMDVALGQQGRPLQLLQSRMEGSNGPLPVPAHYSLGFRV